MSERRTPPAVETRSLSPTPAEQWTLHHVLLDWLGGGHGTPAAATDRDPTATNTAVRRAFETLDAGEESYTRAQLAAMRDVLAAYHHDTAWETERPRLEALLHRVSAALEFE
jgi:hypothetical protein